MEVLDAVRGAVGPDSWLQALSTFLGLLVAIWVGQRSSTDSRKLVEDERRRQANIALDVLARRLEDVAHEAERKLQWLREFGAPEIFSRQASLDEYRAEAQRLRLSAGDTLVSEARGARFFLTGILAVQANLAISLVDSYHALLDSSVATFVVKDPNLGKFYRQSFGATISRELETVRWSAISTAKALEKGFRLPGSPAPEDHRPPLWRRAISLSMLRSWISAKLKPNS